MSIPSHKLDDFRKKIDDIDIRIHDLIMQRAEIVQEISKEKGLSKTAPYQPGREARLLRRILARPAGELGTRAIFAIWRDLVMASINMQGGLTLAVLRNDEDEVAWRLSLEHFGADMDATEYATPVQVLNAVADGRSTIGLLPFSRGEQGPNWWHHLYRQNENSPRVVARLPFLAADAGPKNTPDALVVATFDVEQTGDDHSLFILGGAESASRALVRDAAIGAGLPLVEHQFFAPDGAGAERLHLIDLEGYVTGEDSRLESFVKSFAEAGVALLRVGGYATRVIVQHKDESR